MAEPWEMLYAGLPKLGPGSDDATREALARLPRGDFKRVVDVGCGNGRQTLVLAQELDVPIDAIDLHQPFLDELTRRAEAAKVAALVRPIRMDMAELASTFSDIDLIWSEGAVYHLGFARAMGLVATVLRPDGCAAVSECTWLTDRPPEIARNFFAAAYPAMATEDSNCRSAETAGLAVLDTFVLPHSAWTEGYYDLLEPRARELLKHANPPVREVAREALAEIEVFRVAGASYGYVFYLLQRRP